MNVVDSGQRVTGTHLIVKFILCLILPAYHTVQAELGMMMMMMMVVTMSHDSIKVPVMVCPPSATGWFSP